LAGYLQKAIFHIEQNHAANKGGKQGSEESVF
jgi:hypothetical protein